jgi:hypothetical protein
MTHEFTLNLASNQGSDIASNRAFEVLPKGGPTALCPSLAIHPIFFTQKLFHDLVIDLNPMKHCTTGAISFEKKNSIG